MPKTAAGARGAPLFKLTDIPLLTCPVAVSACLSLAVDQQFEKRFFRRRFGRFVDVRPRARHGYRREMPRPRMWQWDGSDFGLAGGRGVEIIARRAAIVDVASANRGRRVAGRRPGRRG